MANRSAACRIVTLLVVHLSLSNVLAWQSDLGVQVLKPMYAVAPLSTEPVRDATVVLTTWLRRVGGAHVAHSLPHQKKSAIRALVWVDYTGDLHSRIFGHLKLPVDQLAWQPRLRLETASPGPMVEAVVETRPDVLGRVGGPMMRPYSLRFDLPDSLENVTCFKLIEGSYHGHKVPVCLPLEGAGAGGPDTTAELNGNGGGDASISVCTTLAPPDLHTAQTPALWAAIGPVRHAGSTREWDMHFGEVGLRITNYLAYHVAMGLSGLLLYTDAIQRHYLRRQPTLVPYLRSGNLRLVHWDMPERGHANDGKGRGLGYNYDQALFASHALLGLSACGANVMVMISDFDEYLYASKPGNRWPLPQSSCMPSGTPEQPAAVNVLQRMELLSGHVPPQEEAAIWTTVTAGAGEASSAAVHPLARYDRRAPTPMTHNMHNKPIVLPAAEVVAFFVHEGAPLRGSSQIVDKDCLLLLHVANYWRARTNNGQYRRQNVSDFTHFHNWLFNSTQAAVTYLPQVRRA